MIELSKRELNELFYLPDEIEIEMEYNKKLLKLIIKIVLLKLKK